MRTTNSRVSEYLIGTDTGGTFTDCVIAGPDGLAIGKALSTPEDPWRGILGAIEDASRSMGGLEFVLRNTAVLAHGTTAMLNATLTGNGAKVGIITTAGFEDTLAIGRVHQKVAGLAEWEMTDVVRLRKSALFNDKQLIVGIRERVDAQGKVLKALDSEEVKAAACLLRERGAQSFAVGFLWSCANQSHEQQAARAIREVFPDVRVSCSAELSTTIGEYERFATCALNAYIVDIASGYLDTLARQLSARGFAGSVLVTRAWGDLERAELVAERAVPSLFSGPIGGVIGARALAIGHDKEFPVLICADVGGTSFDAAVVYEGNVRWHRRPTIERLHLSVPAIEVGSIGTGGGSIVHFDAELGLIQVGPQSAGGTPGPACYGRGGRHPTVTDAAVVAGWISPYARMPGGIELTRGLASEALERDIARPAGMTVERAAYSVLRIACAHLADLVRKTCIERAVDPRRAVPLVYGGAGAQYAGAMCSEIGMRKFLVPEVASAFSAFGMLGAAEGLVLTRSVGKLLPLDAEWLEATLAEMEQQAREQLGRDANTHFERFAELKYAQQINDLRVELTPDPAIATKLARLFTSAYERRYGSGSGAHGNQIEVTALLVRGYRPITAAQPLSMRMQYREIGDAEHTLSHRFQWLDGKEHEVATHSFAPLRAGDVLRGPTILSENYTSVVVPPAWSARWRADLGMIEVSSDE